MANVPANEDQIAACFAVVLTFKAGGQAAWPPENLHKYNSFDIPCWIWKHTLNDIDDIALTNSNWCQDMSNLDGNCLGPF